MSKMEAVIKKETKEGGESSISFYKQRISCQLCGKEFSQLEKLSYHIYNNCKDEPEGDLQIDESPRPDHPQKSTKSPEKDAADDDNGLRSHACDICGKHFPKLQNLQVHVRSHTGEKPYKCQWCDKTFSSYGNMKAHSRVHTGVRPHQCSQCGKEFGTAQNLQVHIRTHTGEKPYKCAECGKGFAGQGNLKVHQRTHTGEKPYKCQMCGKDFRNLQSLHIHVRSHTGEKPFECTFCHKAFTSQGNMQAHMRIHTGERPFSCGECDKSFSNMQALKIHIRTHTGEKPHVCHVCGKDFASVGNYQVHMRTHTGVRPYSCRMCGKDFTTMSNMQTHMVRTHATELYAENALLWSRMQELSRQYMQMTAMPGVSGDQATPTGPPPLNMAFPMDLSPGFEQLIAANQKLFSASAAAMSLNESDLAEQEQSENENTNSSKDPLTNACPSTSSANGENPKSPAATESDNSICDLGKCTGLKGKTPEEATNSSISHEANPTETDRVMEKPSSSNLDSAPMEAEQTTSESSHGTSDFRPVVSEFRRATIESRASVPDSRLTSSTARLAASEFQPSASESQSEVIESIPAASESRPPTANNPDMTISSQRLDSSIAPSSSSQIATNSASTCNLDKSVSNPNLMASHSSQILNHENSHSTSGSTGGNYLVNPTQNHFTSLSMNMRSAIDTSRSDQVLAQDSTNLGFDPQMHELLAMNRSMQLGYPFPQMNPSLVPNDYAMNMFKRPSMFQAKQTGSLSSTDNIMNMFGFMNNPAYPSSSDHIPSHLTNMFSQSTMHGHSAAAETNSGNLFLMPPNLKSDISSTDLNSVVQTALNMFSCDSGAESEFSDVFSKKSDPGGDSSFTGSGGPVFPTNM
ncbi:uncharacterized protein [Haliotis asinina]|uniref:uncharacterized protein n=1 Tax=Haliotis asinina TaxID=109174 RepID=UPI0035321EF5